MQGNIMKENFKDLLDSIDNNDIVAMNNQFQTISQYNLGNIDNASSNLFVNQEDILNFYTFNSLFQSMTNYVVDLGEEEFNALRTLSIQSKDSLFSLFDTYKQREKLSLELDIIENISDYNSHIETIIINNDFTLEVQSIDEQSKIYDSIESLNAQEEISDYNNVKRKYFDFVYEFKEEVSVEEYIKTSDAIENPEIFKKLSQSNFNTIFKDVAIYFNAEEITKEEMYSELLDSDSLENAVYLINEIENEDLNGFQVFSIQDNSNIQEESLFENISLNNQEQKEIYVNR
jgi:hypothetical protein